MARAAVFGAMQDVRVVLCVLSGVVVLELGSGWWRIRSGCVLRSIFGGEVAWWEVGFRGRGSTPAWGDLFFSLWFLPSCCWTASGNSGLLVDFLHANWSGYRGSDIFRMRRVRQLPW